MKIEYKTNLKDLLLTLLQQRWAVNNEYITDFRIQELSTDEDSWTSDCTNMWDIEATLVFNTVSKSLSPVDFTILNSGATLNDDMNNDKNDSNKNATCAAPFSKVTAN